MGVGMWNGNNGMNEIHHVSELFFVFVKVIFVVLFLFLTVAANCHLWAYFIWACFAFVLRSLSHHLHLFHSLYLSLARACICPKADEPNAVQVAIAIFWLMQFIIMATAAETAAAAAEAATAPASAAIAIELPFGNECRPNAAADTGATWVTQKKKDSKETEKNKTKLKKRPRNKSENLFCYCLDVCTACK